MEPYIGTWHITEMSMWSAGYFNMEGQAYLEIRPNRMGRFHFGLIYCDIDGVVEEVGDVKRFFFTFEGREEMWTEVSGAGWVRRDDKDRLSGWFKFHSGDASTFEARRAK